MRDIQPATATRSFSLPVFEAKEVVRALLRSEFEVLHQKTATVNYLTPPPHSVAIPRHDRFDLFQPIRTSTLGQAEMTLEDFLRYL